MNNSSKRKYLLYPVLWPLLACIIALSVYFFLINGFSFFVTIGALLYVLVIHLTPLLTLYFTHLKSSKNVSVSFFGKNLGSFRFKDKTYSVPIDIDFVEHYLSLPLYHERFDWSFWNHYHYFIFVTKSGDRVVISCLQLERRSLPEYLDIQKKKKLFLIPPASSCV